MINSNNNNPPKWMMKLLQWFCHPDMVEDVEGDLSELYSERRGVSRFPKLLMFWDVLLLFRPGIIKDNIVTRYFLTQSMYKNYMKSAWRNLLKHKTFSLINISSLSVGMAICLVIFLFVQEELSFDNFHKKNIYRFWETEKYEGSSGQDIPFTMGGVGPVFTDHFPEILQYTRVLSVGDEVIELKDGNVLMDGIKSVDHNFFQLFDFNLINGDRNNVFRSYKDVAISRSTAMNLYRTLDVVGKTFRRDGEEYVINAVFEDIAENSHLQFKMVFSLENFIKVRGNYNNEFTGSFITTYVEMTEDADYQKLYAAFPEVLDNASGKNHSENYTLYLQALRDIHLGSSFMVHDYYNYRKFDRLYLNIFIFIGVLLLIIAIINFTNLTTARSGYRTKEVGVRKTLGAIRNQVVMQFQLETILLSFMALIVSILLVWAGLPYLNNLIERSYELQSIFMDQNVILATLLLTIMIGVIAGIYPSLYLSKFKLTEVIKGFTSKSGKSYLRSGLVVVQFSLAIGMIVSTMIIIDQLSYIKNKDLGFNKEHILQVSLIDDDAMNFYDQMKQELLKQSNVLGVTGSGHRIGNDFHQRGFKIQLDSGLSFFVPASLYVDHDYLDVFDIELIAGRNFSNDFSTDDGLAFIVNQSMTKDLGLEDAIGVKAGMGWYPNDSLGSIIGVTKDFNFNTLHNEIDNLILLSSKAIGYREMSVKLNGSNLKESVRQVEEIYNKYSDIPIQYQFLDDHFDQLYKSDQQMQSVLSLIGALSIIIGCMGLFGLTSITVQNRLKEIGIRKVLGASRRQLLVLLSKDFGLSVILAFIISAPASYYLMNLWLDNFAYRITINPLLFILGGVLSFVIAWLTISLQVGKAVRANPVESLKYE
ncbi:MAG: FtsX-like permease family protein [bacterium]|nr:FtsX-like permease family protein [bacterium]